jgi:flavin-binding protein dodecin
MANHVYAVSEVVGSSHGTIEDAIENAPQPGRQKHTGSRRYRWLWNQR